MTHNEASVDRSVSVTKHKVLVLCISGFYLGSAIVTAAWPADWSVPMPLAMLSGPWLAIRIGGEIAAFGWLGLLATIGLTLPSLCTRNEKVRALLPLAGAVWVGVGAVAGGSLWAS